MSDGVAYSIQICDKSGQGHRSIYIVTDTIQNALSIAKAKCRWDEVVYCVQEISEVFIDYSVCKGDGK